MGSCRPSQPSGVMSSAVSLPNHTFTGDYGKPFYYLLSKIDILYIISDILYRI